MLIDGVFSGGGLKGFALVGAYEVLEEKGYQFKRVAGTSAGAILASFIAAGYTAKEIELLFDDLDLTSLSGFTTNDASISIIKMASYLLAIRSLSRERIGKMVFRKVSR